MLGLIVLLQALTLAIAGPPSSPEYLPIWVAAADGHFDRQKLKVTVKPTRSEVGAAEALAQSQADLVATSLEAMLRFGARDAQNPRLFFGLTAAPPVALLVAANNAVTITTVHDLAGLRIGISAPGAAEHTWLNGILARGGLGANQVNIVSVGERGLPRALLGGDVQAAFVHDPVAARLVGERLATALVDLRTPADAERVLGGATVSAGVFLRAERRVGEAELAAFAKALIAAQERIAGGDPEGLAAKLPKSVVGIPDEFAARLGQAKYLYLAKGRVTANQLQASETFLKDQLPLPSRARIQLLVPPRAAGR
jgi:NitT/TauT family transport system substrate-binding protein